MVTAAAYPQLAAIADQHGLESAALQSFVDNILRRMIFDGEQLSDLMAPLELGWKARTKAELEARLRGDLLEVFSVDKFPKMTDYVVPSGVRVAHTARVRLGAYLGEGTTIMHEGFVNFNAGTAGPGMIEGRVSAGVFVGKGSDLGGGCSTMGTLSGGGNIVISVGEGCLIGIGATRLPEWAELALGIPATHISVAVVPSG